MNETYLNYTALVRTLTGISSRHLDEAEKNNKKSLQILKQLGGANAKKISGPRRNTPDRRPR